MIDLRKSHPLSRQVGGHFPGIEPPIVTVFGEVPDPTPLGSGMELQVIDHSEATVLVCGDCLRLKNSLFDGTYGASYKADTLGILGGGLEAAK